MRWIKIETATPDKGEITQAAKDCRVSRGDAFLAFFRLFAWLDEATADGWVQGATRRQFDERAGLAGLAQSLERSGWLAFSDAGCQVTNWDAHNGQCAKRRALNARRMAHVRDEMRRNGQYVKPCPQPREWDAEAPR